MFVVFGVACFVLGIFATLLLTLDLLERGAAVEEAERVERRKAFAIAGGFGSETYDWRPDFRASEQGETETR